VGIENFVFSFYFCLFSFRQIKIRKELYPSVVSPTFKLSSLFWNLFAQQIKPTNFSRWTSSYQATTSEFKLITQRAQEVSSRFLSGATPSDNGSRSLPLRFYWLGFSYFINNSINLILLFDFCDVIQRIEIWWVSRKIPLVRVQARKLKSLIGWLVS
jgi:hypothetical protein